MLNTPLLALEFFCYILHLPSLPPQQQKMKVLEFFSYQKVTISHHFIISESEVSRRRIILEPWGNLLISSPKLKPVVLCSASLWHFMWFLISKIANFALQYPPAPEKEEKQRWRERQVLVMQSLAQCLWQGFAVRKWTGDVLRSLTSVEPSHYQSDSFPTAWWFLPDVVSYFKSASPFQSQLYH